MEDIGFHVGGPNGSLMIKEPLETLDRVLLFSGGIGCTPMVALLEDLLNKDYKGHNVLDYIIIIVSSASTSTLTTASSASSTTTTTTSKTTTTTNHNANFYMKARLNLFGVPDLLLRLKHSLPSSIDVKGNQTLTSVSITLVKIRSQVMQKASLLQLVDLALLVLAL